MGNVTGLADMRAVQPLQSYSYDERDRLKSWTLGSMTQSYSYDSIGSLTLKAGITQTYGATGLGTGAGPHQARSVGGAAYAFDAYAPDYLDFDAAPGAQRRRGSLQL